MEVYATVLLPDPLRDGVFLQGFYAQIVLIIFVLEPEPIFKSASIISSINPPGSFEDHVVLKVREEVEGCHCAT